MQFKLQSLTIEEKGEKIKDKKVADCMSVKEEIWEASQLFQSTLKKK